MAILFDLAGASPRLCGRAGTRQISLGFFPAGSFIPAGSGIFNR